MSCSCSVILFFQGGLFQTSTVQESCCWNCIEVRFKPESEEVYLGSPWWRNEKESVLVCLLPRQVGISGILLFAHPALFSLY